MPSLTPKERLDAHAERLKARGVRDIKFSCGDLTGVTVDQLASDFADVLDAIESGRTTLVASNVGYLGDSVRPKTASPGAQCSGAGSGEQDNEANEKGGTAQ